MAYRGVPCDAIQTVQAGLTGHTPSTVHDSSKPSCSVITWADCVYVGAPLQQLFVWNCGQFSAFSSVYHVASGTRLGKQTPSEGWQPDALVSLYCLRELVGRRDLSLSLSSFPSPQPLHGTSLAEPIARFMAESPVTYPSVENESISNQDITQSQIRFGRVYVCVWPSTRGRPRTLATVSWSCEAICS